jgi:hypothetical protein
MHGCSMIEHLDILPSLCVTFRTNIIWASRLAVVHHHLLHHYPGHHIILFLSHQTTLYGAISRDKWMCITITTMLSFAELWKRRSPPLHHKCFSTCYAEHSGTSGCVSIITLRVQIHLMYSDSCHMVC